MFDFKKFLDVGDCLKKVDCEEYHRSAISRYYYSLFGCARAYLVAVLNEFEFSKGKDVHKRICDRLIKSDDNTENALGLKLEELRQLRNDADYNWHLDDKYFREQIIDVKINCEIAHEHLNALRKSPPFEL